MMNEVVVPIASKLNELHLKFIFIYLNSDEGEVIVQKNYLPFKTCMNAGTDYYRTFDGQEFTFGGRCTYVLARAKNEWNVLVEHVHCDRYSTCKKVIKMLKHFW